MAAKEKASWLRELISRFTVALAAKAAWAAIVKITVHDHT